MFPHAVMKDWHPMIGVDLHICNPPPPAPPIPMTPYRTAMLLHGTAGWFLTTRYCPTHHSAGLGVTMARGTDIGPLIPHIGPPSITLPIEVAFSASKSHFGPRNYVEKDNTGGKNHIAAALGGFINPNLNCGTPCPTPTGMVLALNTHGVGMTPGDIAAGMTQMVVDVALQTALGYLGNGVGAALGYLAKKVGPQVLTRVAARNLYRNLPKAARPVGLKFGDAAKLLRAKQAARVARWNSGIGRGLGVFINVFGGGPMGADAGSDAVKGPTAFGSLAKLGGEDGEDGPFGKYVANGGNTLTDYVNGGPPVVNEGESAPIVSMFSGEPIDKKGDSAPIVPMPDSGVEPPIGHEGDSAPSDPRVSLPDNEPLADEGDSAPSDPRVSLPDNEGEPPIDNEGDGAPVDFADGPPE